MGIKNQNRSKVLLCLLSILLFSCAKRDDKQTPSTSTTSTPSTEVTSQTTRFTVPTTTVQTTVPEQPDPTKYLHKIKEEDIIKKTFDQPSFPQEVKIAPFYFNNFITAQTYEYQVDCPYGDCKVSIDQLTGLKDKEMMSYVNQQIAILMDQWIQKGLPKYPGMLVIFKEHQIRQVNFSVRAYQTVNDILCLYFTTIIGLDGNYESSRESVRSESIHYFDLHTGRQLTMNDIMNSETGLKDLYALLFNNTDAFWEPGDNPDHSTLYNIPFQTGMKELPSTTSILIQPKTISIILNDDCKQCYFPVEYDRLTSKTIYLKDVSSISLYDRYFKPDMSNYVSKGTIHLNLDTKSIVSQHFDELEEVLIDEKQNLFIRTGKVTESKSYLLDEAETMIQELLQDAAAVSKKADIKLTKENFDAYLSYYSNRLADNIEIHYYISSGEKSASGVLKRSFHPVTKKQLTLYDLIKKDVDVLSLYNKNSSIYGSWAYDTTKEEIFKNLESYDFGFDSDFLTLYTKPLKKIGGNFRMEEVPIILQWIDIGLENFSDYLLHVDAS